MRLALGLGLVLGPSAVRAQPFQVSPVLVELTPRARSAIVTVQNLGAEPMRLQASAFEWRQDRRGETLLAPARDIVFFPGLLTVAPGAKRNLRVGAAEGAPFAATERAYRIFIEQLPPRTAEGEKGVRVLTRVSIPVFLEPPKPTSKGEIAGLRLEGRKVAFSLLAGGNVRIKPSAVRVVARDEWNAPIAELPLPAWYVLAGDERAYEAEIPRDVCARVRTIVAEATVRETVVRAQVNTPDGACAP